MAEIEVHGSLKNLSAAPDIAFQFQPNGQPWASVLAAHNGTPEAYRAVGKTRFVVIEGRLREYWYSGGIAVENLVPRYENLDNAQEYIEQLETLRAETEAFKFQAEQWARFAGAHYEEKGDYNVETNTPALTADATVGQSNPEKLQRYIITVGGALAFAIKDMPAGTVVQEGYLVQHPNGEWMYDPKDTVALGRLVELEGKVVVGDAADDGITLVIEGRDGQAVFAIMNNRQILPPLPRTEKYMLSEEIYNGLIHSRNVPGFHVAWVDKDGNVVAGITTAGKQFPSITEPVRYTSLTDAVKKQMLVQMEVPGFITAQVDEKGNVLAGIMTNGQVYPPVVNKAVSTTVSTVAKKNRVNQYPQVFERLRKFASRMLGQTARVTGDNAVRVVAWGDSILAREVHTSLGAVVPDIAPPGLVTNNFLAQLYAEMDMQKPAYLRYDAAGAFTETGAFTSVVNKAAWDDANDRPTHTRLSVVESAAVAFAIPADVVQCNWIDRTATDGAAVNTISTTPGQVEVMLPGTEVWVEADGAVFSQVQVAGTRIGNTAYQRRIPFRRKSGVSGVLNITVTKDATTNALMYWGVERLVNTKSYVQLINMARGGHTLEQLVGYMETDVIERRPDLVLLEIPLINMVAVNSTMAYNLNWVQDVVWGDRVGFENTWNLKAKSNNWQDFEVLLVIPHATRDQMNADNTWKVLASGLTAPEIYNAVKGLIYSKGDVGMVDIFSAFKRHVANNYSTYYTAMTGTGLTGISLSSDNIHQNDNGTAIYVDEIIPIFSFSNY